MYLVVESLLCRAVCALKGINTLMMFSFPVTEKLIFREHCKQNIRSFTLFPYFAFTKTMSEFTEGDFPDFWDHFKDAILAFYNATSDKY